MKKLTTLIVVFFTCSLSAQMSADNLPAKIGSVTGKVIDEKLKQPISYATVVVKNKANGSAISGGITNDNGEFELKDIEEGTHIFEVQYIGYETYTKEITISRGNRKVNLGTIVLSENAIELEGVDVVAERTTIEQKIDRKVVNVGKDLTTAGATAADIMNNIPSVSVDAQTGALSLRGNQNVRVMVDGKLSNVPVEQLLKQIPSTSIKSIELITNPSAKYNPEGMSGIVNIILHKNANIGFNGSLNLGLTHDINAKFNSTVDLNFRKGKFNIYGNYGTNIGKYTNHGHVVRPIENSEQFFNFTDSNKSHLYKIGLDFYLSEKNVISIFTNQNIFKGKSSGITDLVFYNDQSLNYSQNAFPVINDNNSEQYNFDYKHDFEKEGHNIELEVDYNRFNEDSNFNFVFSGNTTLSNYKDFVGTFRDQFTANLDYVNPISEKTKLETGAEARLFSSDIDYSSTGLSYNSNGVLRPTPDSNFTYDMDIYSAYINISQNFEKWSYQLGVRLENVEVQADTNKVRAFTDKYTQVYPSGFITYKPNEKNQYQLSVSRRVDRPGLSQVNPFREWSTPQISSLGNPELVPQFTNSIETNYTRNLEKGSITAGLFYRLINDEINRAVYIDRVETEKIILTHDNFDKTSAYGIELSSNYKPLSWWNFNASFDLFSQKQRSITEVSTSVDGNITEDEIENREIEVTNTRWSVRMNNNFKVTKKLTLSAFGMYRAANKGIQFESKPMYFVNVGARYNFADGNGTISLNYNDIFDTMRFAFDANNPYRQWGDFHWESQTVYLGLSYRFGSGKDRRVQRKDRDSNIKEGGGGIL